MANNRMWIRHKVSGKKVPLARNSGYWSVGMSLSGNEDVLEELDNFFFDHMCQDQENDGSNYEIVTEE